MDNLFLKTRDRVQIAVNHYCNGKDEVVIVAPGWCMTKDSDAFSKISEMFSKFYDVISFDFRGHGKSGGMYTFTSKELMDLDAVVRYARKAKYSKIYLAGFSLGAAESVIYASKSRFIDKLILVSVPSSFEKIENQMWKKEAWGETFKKFELDRFASIRPYPVPMKKERPVDVIKKIKIPTLFLAGEKDPTVHSWHTEELYNEAVCTKYLKVFDKGCHAEDLFLHFKEEFEEICIGWLKNNLS